MEKTLVINEREIRIKATGFTPILYKMTFKSDLFKDLIKAVGGYNNVIAADKAPDDEALAMEMLENLDIAFFYQLLWANAKSADNSIPEMETWLGSFDALPILELIQDLIEVNFSNLESKKK